ncbi:hypothetical protein PIB30_032016 [Stylosanthes scabra]|uniref:Uncharacterized protein n=1 Tax=Stylosanthes scabra TaxID=79078 RepID=A0ABU6WAJ9_9FABA|nr:hypothetical protein [Stylosanthes scabra]
MLFGDEDTVAQSDGESVGGDDQRKRRRRMGVDDRVLVPEMLFLITFFKESEGTEWRRRTVKEVNGVHAPYMDSNRPSPLVTRLNPSRPNIRQVSVALFLLPHPKPPSRLDRDPVSLTRADHSLPMSNHSTPVQSDACTVVLPFGLI